MGPVFILIIAGLTSVGIFVLGVTRLRLSKSGLWLAVGKTCECVGLTLVFLLLNLAVGGLAILAGRSLSGRFVSLYLVSDITLLMLALLQALTFQAWRDGSRHHHISESRGHGPLRREL
ncbi:MAG: hypothetical protein ACRERE_11825 [Candidatus Entotheonellia bacterium]